jgi:hypothetical protein
MHIKPHCCLIGPGKNRYPSECGNQYFINFGLARRAKPLNRPQTRLFALSDQEETARAYPLLKITRASFVPPARTIHSMLMACLAQQGPMSGSLAAAARSN